MEKKGKIRLSLLTCLLIIIMVGVTLFGIWYYYSHIKSPNYDKKFEKIQILYDYGNIMSFFGNDEEKNDNMFKVDLQGEELTELQNILINYDIESEKYKIKETGHYHGLTFYSDMAMIPSEYKVKFNDGSEMIINERGYEIQYKDGNNYYLIPDGKAISQKVIQLVDEKLHKEVIKTETKLITIKGLTSGKTLNIGNQEIILKLLNEFRYAKDVSTTKELYDKLIEYEKDDYDNGRKNYRELEYKIDFNNGTIIKVELRNGNVGCISDENNNFVEGIKINSKFTFMIHNIFTDYFREKDRVFEAEVIDLQYNNKERKLTDSEKTEFLSKLLRVEIDGNSSNYSSTHDYILKINNNKIILEQKLEDNYLYIVYANGESSRIYSLDLADYIKNLIK